MLKEKKQVIVVAVHVSCSKKNDVCFKCLMFKGACVVLGVFHFSLGAFDVLFTGCFLLICASS